ncbi:LPXTG cell wall anchor domain-containing protein [Plantactinospora sonchi]|uniref:LPXTG cell wall anchor domain-containing protein n=1 Tax=Plantactinospora sonchi TaxID=1544735 RepID=A0ABU7RNU4_9ACTN
MTSSTRRAWTRVGAGALAVFATGALLATGGVAHAEPAGADLGLTVSDSTMELGELREHQVIVRNDGPDPVSGWHLEYDFSGLDDTLITRISTQAGYDCELTGDRMVCPPGGNLAPGASFAQTTPYYLERAHDRPGGDAGAIVVTVVSEGDPEPANNTTSFDVTVDIVGPVVSVFTWDVYQMTEDGTLTDKPVPPGGTTRVRAVLAGGGDQIAKGVKVRVRLPQYVTFSEVDPNCVYEPDNQTATCEYPDIVLLTPALDKPGYEDGVSAVYVYFPVRVADDAPGPVVAPGGLMAVDHLGVLPQAEAAGTARGRSAELPDGVEVAPAENLGTLPDDWDDHDGHGDDLWPFSAHIAGPAGDGNGGGGAGDGLPVTGVQAGLIGGIGAGVLLVGGLLLFLARRRRVVLVAPGDEKPTA